MRRDEHGGVLGLLGEGQELLTQGVRRLELGAYVIIMPESTQHGEKLVRVFQVCTELPSVGVRLSHFGAAKPCVAMSDAPKVINMSTSRWRRCRGLGERLEQREPLTEMR